MSVQKINFVTNQPKMITESFAEPILATGNHHRLSLYSHSVSPSSKIMAFDSTNTM